MMSHEQISAAGKLTALGVINVPAVFAAATDTTWLAAGTFILTLGGAIQVLYKMKIDADRDQTKAALDVAIKEIELLKEARVEDKQDLKDAKAENAKLVADAKADADAEIGKLRRRAHQVEGTQDLILGAQDKLKIEQKAIRENIAAIPVVQDVRVVNTENEPTPVHVVKED